MRIAERAAAYRKAFPQYPDSWPTASRRWLNATWMLGNDYRGTALYGSYPPTYLRRITTMFSDCSRVMHLFSGSLPPGAYTRVDASPERHPDVLVDAAHGLVDAVGAGSYDVIYADTPYSKEDAENYGLPMPDRRRVLRQCHAVLPPGGQLVWMDTQLPMYRGDMWIHYGNITLIRSTNHRIRLVSLFKRLP